MGYFSEVAMAIEEAKRVLSEHTDLLDPKPLEYVAEGELGNVSISPSPDADEAYLTITTRDGTAVQLLLTAAQLKQLRWVLNTQTKADK